MTTFQRAKKWILAEPSDTGHHCIDPSIPSGIATMLAHRGITEQDAVEKFFAPNLSELPDPLLMKGMGKAVNTLLQAIVQKRPVIIYGDYDVDGVTGAAVLALFLREVGALCHVHQPNRKQHGYGLNEGLLRDLAAQQEAPGHEAVLLTVDCGISNVREVEIARSLGFSVIITDHHRLPATLPQADAILNPLQKECGFPYKDLAGVGVAFYLTVGLRAEMRKNGLFSARKEPNLKESLDLVAIGTLCDMVPLNGVNRILVKAGMEVIRRGGRIGLQALAKVSGLSSTEKVSVEDIGFRIGPRLNAAGRLDKADKAYRLLVSDDVKEAQFLANELERLNEARKELTETVFLDCCQYAESMRKKRVSLVIAGDDWHPGVLGIVASKLVQKYYLPTILLSRASTEQGVFVLKGSGRSVNGFNIFDALQKCEKWLEKYGGHEQAAGMTIKDEYFDHFSTTFEATARKRLKEEDLREKLEVYDVATVLEGDCSCFLHYFKKMEPFGVGNREPVFAAFGCRLMDMRVVGEKHLRFCIDLDGQKIFQGIGFNRGTLLQDLKKRKVDAAFTLRLNQFRGEENWQACLVDIKESSTP